MNHVYTHTQLLAIINMVVSGNHPGSTIDDRVYTLDEIVERTGWAKSTLEEELRAGVFKHTGKGRTVGMTPTQLAKAIALHEKGGTALAARQADDDELAKVREASRSAQKRSPRRQRKTAA